MSLCIHEHSSISSTMQSGISPLYVASLLGNAEVVDTLLKNGADPNLATKVWGQVYSSLTMCAKHFLISGSSVNVGGIYTHVCRLGLSKYYVVLLTTFFSLSSLCILSDFSALCSSGSSCSGGPHTDC